MPERDRVCLQVLSECNMRCRFCDVWTRRQRLDLDLTERLVRQLVDRGVRNFDLTGGEPLLWPGLAELVEHVRRLGGTCSVTTNGLLLTDAVARRLAQAGLNHLQMSLDGIDGTHDRLRGHPGAFAAVMAALPVLAAFPGTKNLAVAVMDENVEDLPAIEALADEYQVGLWFTPTAAYTDHMSRTIRLPDPRQLEGVAGRMSRPRSREKLGWIAAALRNGEQIECKVPDIRYTILADATLAPCAFLPGCGDLRRESVEAVDASAPMREACRRARAREQRACRGCYIWSTR